MSAKETVKLTEAQRRVLTALSAGHRLHYIKGLNARYFWSDRRRAPLWQSVQVLIDAGYAETKKEDWRGFRVHITPAGHSALSQTDTRSSQHDISGEPSSSRGGE